MASTCKSNDSTTLTSEDLACAKFSELEAQLDTLKKMRQTYSHGYDFLIQPFKDIFTSVFQGVQVPIYAFCGFFIIALFLMPSLNGFSRLPSGEKIRILILLCIIGMIIYLKTKLDTFNY